MAHCLQVEKAEVFRFEDDGAPVAVACQVSPGITHIGIGERITAEDHKVAAALLRTGFAAMPTVMTTPQVRSAHGFAKSGWVRWQALQSSWMVASGAWPSSVPRARNGYPDTKQRIAEFADLVATAIAACTTRADLIASRARIVAASDEARRRLERDLHDGAQQRLVSVRLKLRSAASTVPDDWMASGRRSPRSGQI